MATFNKFNSFIDAVTKKQHNLGTDQLVVFLTNTAPVATNTQLSNITEVSYTNCSSRNITSSTSASSGTTSITLTDITLTASGGTVGPFQYIGVYNDAATNDELVGWYEYPGGSITLADGESLAIDFATASLTFE